MYGRSFILIDKDERNHAVIALEGVPKSALLVIAKMTMPRFSGAVFVNFMLPYRASSSGDVDQFEPEASGDA